MFKRVCFLGVLSILCCMLMACDSDNSPKDECEIDADCLDPSLDTRRGCYLISGVRVCRNSCLATKEGDNAPVCYLPLSAASEPEPTVSVIDKCAKDEEDRLYSAHSEREFCRNYCNKKSGLCKTADEIDECANNAQCAEPDAGTNKGCFRISGVRKCKEICLGSKEGKNDPVCYLPSTINPPPEPNVSVTDTCAKDDVGRLYVVDTVHELCPNYCDEATGLCKTSVPATECKKDCTLDGGDPQVCVILSGKEECKTACFGKSEGKNEPVCYTNTTVANPVAESIIDECAKDEQGTLYSVKYESTTCPNGCEDGVCQ